MIISSRTPEGEPNTCPVCLKELRIDPSTMPIRDAPCPHCGHLLRFDGQTRLVDLFMPPKQAVSSTSFEKAVLEIGTARLGTFPFELRDQLLETIASVALKHRLPEKCEVARIVEAAEGWPDVISDLQRIVEFESAAETTRPSHLIIRKVMQNLFAKLAGGKGS